MNPQDDATRHSLTVPVQPKQAFRVFTSDFGAWWPSEYTWSGEVLESIGIGSGAGGRCTEIGPEGFECDWGRVLAWEPPRRLVLAWHIGPHREPQPNPDNASTIEIRFEAAEAAGTRVELEHRGFERHGAGAAEYRDALGSERGWPWILSRYAGRF